MLSLFCLRSSITSNGKLAEGSAEQVNLQACSRSVDRVRERERDSQTDRQRGRKRGDKICSWGENFQKARQQARIHRAARTKSKSRAYGKNRQSERKRPLRDPSQNGGD